ncbi:hypothetical protein [uncultured Pontibacter sp.]|uniref:hypothetical protein n=1 Tax=uncultured Pontibacter sp. TaxID=453356 RepID=UPI00262EB7A3|nr:hypothetical protein [uncultured Pontibacter sp.]
MKKNYIYILLLSVVVSLSSCFDDNETAYEGPLQVEFPLATKTVIVGSAAKVDSIKVQLIGPQQAAPLEGKFKVVEGTTAIEGTSYTFATAGKFTVAANSSFGYIVVNLPKSGSSSVLKLELEDSDKLKAASNYKKLTYNIKP